MSEIPKLDHPIFTPFDLGALDADLAGVQVGILRNPTLRFRAGFRAASMNPQGDDWQDYVAAILDVEPAALMDTLGDLQQAIVDALFVTRFERFDAEAARLIGESPAYVFRIWDDHAQDRRKTYGGRS